MIIRHVFSILLLTNLIAVSLELNAQNSVSFNFTNGSQNVYSLVDVRKIDFSGNTMNLHLFDGSVYSWEINNLSYYNYNSATPSNIEDFLSKINSWEVAIFPNPTDGFQTLNLKLGKPYDVTISIVDATGKTIMKRSLGKLPIGDQSIALEWNEASNGIYSFVFSTNDFTLTKKIIKK